MDTRFHIGKIKTEMAETPDFERLLQQHATDVEHFTDLGHAKHLRKERSAPLYNLLRALTTRI